uniref:Uncharacterized protein n=1 Tax=Compsopogon caeruleus TaxID=31354 RepID=A0A7S1T538_9RHOD|mmetsp:Transcript_1022/g.2170  ORF Transcript_1022/g.2170 Transcript_1022/m.2170 type:complete len:681 (+) Transcript_1022:247-2289(+)
MKMETVRKFFEVLQSGDGKATVSMESLGKLLEMETNWGDDSVVPDAPDMAVVWATRMRGQIEKDVVELYLELEIETLHDKWVRVPLLGTPTAMESIQMVKEDSPEEGKRIHAYIIPSPDGVFMFSAFGIAKWKVSFRATLPIHDGHTRSFHLRIPCSVQTELRMRSPLEESHIEVDPKLKMISTSDPEGSWIEVTLPPTEFVRVTWSARRVEMEDDIARIEAPEQVLTADQYIVYSIQEDLCRVRARWLLGVFHRPRHTLNIAIPSNMTVRNVQGDNLRKWEIVHLETGAERNRDEISSALSEEATRCVRLFHSSGVKGPYDFEMEAEMKMDANQGMNDEHSHGAQLAMSLKTFHVLDAEREHVFVTVEASSNIEVQELSKVGAMRIDESELPGFLLRDHSYPSVERTVFCFKAPNPNFDVTIGVCRHEEVDVLTAIIEEAWLETTVSANNSFTKVQLKMRNSSKQFLRCSLPEESTTYSTEVDCLPVKPARDANQEIMIPLPRKRGPSGDTWVDITYISTHTPLEARGALILNLPKVDVPINQLFLTVFLPYGFSFGDFSGDLREVERHSSELNRSKPFETLVAYREADIDGLPPQSFPQRAVRLCSTHNEALMQESSVIDSTKPHQGRSEGLVPVHVDSLREGKQFNFERLLVNDEELKLQLGYRRDETPFWRRKWFR